MSAVKSSPLSNLLLTALSAPERKRLLEQGEVVHLRVGTVLAEPGDKVRHVIFPVESYISLIAPMGTDRQLQVGLVGNEGLHGATTAFGVRAAPLRAVVQGAGTAWRLETAKFCRQADDSPALQRVVNRYLYVQLSQFAQMAACTHFHVIEARLARWLLTTRDRACSETLLVTHEFLSAMLGVQRVGVTGAAGALQRGGLIRYQRGSVEILDARGLEAAACPCYAAANASYANVLG